MFARNKRMDASMSSNTIPTLVQRDSSPSTVLNTTSSMGPSAPKKSLTPREEKHRGDLHVAVVAAQNVGPQMVSTRVFLEEDMIVLLETAWSSKTEPQSWADSQIGVIRCTEETKERGVIVFVVHVQGKGLYAKKVKLGEARVPVSEASKMQAAVWLDIETTTVGTRESQHLSKARPQLMVKFLYVASHVTNAQYVERRRALLAMPLPEKLKEVVTELKAAEKSLVDAKTGRVAELAADGGGVGRRRRSTLFDKNSQRALDQVLRASSSPHLIKGSTVTAAPSAKERADPVSSDDEIFVPRSSSAATTAARQRREANKESKATPPLPPKNPRKPLPTTEQETTGIQSSSPPPRSIPQPTPGSSNKTNPRALSAARSVPSGGLSHHHKLSEEDTPSPVPPRRKIAAGADDDDDFAESAGAYRAFDAPAPSSLRSTTTIPSKRVSPRPLPRTSAPEELGGDVDDVAGAYKAFDAAVVTPVKPLPRVGPPPKALPTFAPPLPALPGGGFNGSDDDDDHKNNQNDGDDDDADDIAGAYRAFDAGGPKSPPKSPRGIKPLPVADEPRKSPRGSPAPPARVAPPPPPPTDDDDDNNTTDDASGAYRAFDALLPPPTKTSGDGDEDNDAAGGYKAFDEIKPMIRSKNSSKGGLFLVPSGGAHSLDEDNEDVLVASRMARLSDDDEDRGDRRTGGGDDDDDDDDESERVANIGGYKMIVNQELEAEMDEVVGNTLPVNSRGRAGSLMFRKKVAAQQQQHQQQQQKKPSAPAATSLMSSLTTAPATAESKKGLTSSSGAADDGSPPSPEKSTEWKDMDSFNSRFQAAVEMMALHGAQSNTRRVELINSCMTVIRLAQDFATLASQYGKTIISEHALPEKFQTIKPRTDLGGVLGGQKYIVLGILFKFATDEKGLFRALDDPLEAANKIAGLELKGLKCYFSTRTPNLSFPLMALIDYKGYRLVAMSVLPIDKTTLMYGSMDAGRTILHENDDLTLLINEASRQLNLKPHMVGPRGSETEFLSAADLEGHVGHDGRFYMLDFSRSMPPVHSGMKDRPDHLYQQFRPEFLRGFASGPLSPDACSMFGRHNAHIHDKEIVVATERLKGEHIPNVARELVSLKEWTVDPSSFSLSEALHRRGVNMRYLGLVLHEVKLCHEESLLVQLILIEMCARVLKNKLRKAFRGILKGLKDPSEAPFNDRVMEEYNTIFGQNVGSHDLWNVYIPQRLQSNFSVSPQDLPQDLHNYMRKINLKDHQCGKWFLMIRVNNMTGIEVDPAVLEQLQSEPKMFERAEVLDYLDVVGLKERLKPLNIINQAKGEFYYLKGLMRHNHSSSIEYFVKAEGCLEDVLSSSPTDPQLLATMGNILLEHSKKLAMMNPTDPEVKVLLQRGKQYFLQAIRYDDDNFMIFRDYAIFLEHMDDLDGAEDYYLRSLAINPNQMECLRRYGAFLRTFRGEPDEAARFFDRYKMICEQFADGLKEKSPPVTSIPSGVAGAPPIGPVGGVPTTPTTTTTTAPSSSTLGSGSHKSPRPVGGGGGGRPESTAIPRGGAATAKATQPPPINIDLNMVLSPSGAAQALPRFSSHRGGKNDRVEKGSVTNLKSNPQ